MVSQKEIDAYEDAILDIMKDLAKIIDGERRKIQGIKYGIRLLEKELKKSQKTLKKAMNKHDELAKEYAREKTEHSEEKEEWYRKMWGDGHNE